MIIWGTKRVESKMGFVAEFCPICRVITPFKVIRIGMTSHIYYISYGKGKLVGHIAECQVCQTVKTVNPTGYAAFEKREGIELERLIQKTFPNIREAYAARLSLEEKIRSQSLGNAFADRESLLLEPFHYLASQVEERYAGSTQFDKESGIGCLGTILLTVILLTATFTIFKNGANQDQALMVTGVIVLVGLIYTVIQIALAPRRFLSRKIIPNLVRSLKPLNPSKQELVTCLDKFKTSGYRIGKKVSAEKLWQALQTRYTSSYIKTKA